MAIFSSGNTSPRLQQIRQVILDFVLGCLIGMLLWVVRNEPFSFQITLGGIAGLLSGLLMRRWMKTENYLRILIVSLPSWIVFFLHFSYPQQALIPLLFMFMSDYGIKKEFSFSSILSWQSIRSVLIPLLAIPMVVYVIFPFVAGSLLSSKENTPAPTLGWQSLSGNSITSSELEGKVVIVDFWGTWCGPCIAAFPQWELIFQTFKDHPEVELIMLNTLSNGDNINKVQAFMEQKAWELPVGLDVHDLSEKAAVRSIPNTIIIDKQGMIRYRHTGFLPGEDLSGQIERQILTLLQEK